MFTKTSIKVGINDQFLMIFGCSTSLQYLFHAVTQEILQNSIVLHMPDTSKDLDCLRLQVCKSIINISISYLFTYLNLIESCAFKPYQIRTKLFNSI